MNTVLDSSLSTKVSRSLRRLQDFCPPSGYYPARADRDRVAVPPRSRPPA